MELIEEHGRLAKPLDEAAAGYVEAFGAGNVLFLQYELDFDRTAPAYERKIYDFLGLPPTSWRHRMATAEVNSGVLPRFVHAGPEGYVETRDGIDYRVPRDRLVICNGRPEQNSFLKNPTAADLRRAAAITAAWTLEVPEALYLQLQETYAWPLAQRIERRLGLDMGHWRVPAVKRPSYRPAPLPDAYIRDPVLRAERLARPPAWR